MIKLQYVSVLVNRIPYDAVIKGLQLFAYEL